MLSDHIFISASPGEVRIAETAQGELTAYTVHRAGAETRVGDVYLGRVEAVLQGIQAAFVDIGEARAGFLALPEARPFRPGNQGDPEDDITDYLSEGDTLLVQVTRDAEQDKGAKLTTRISLTGRDLVFTPLSEGLSVSRRIGGDAERKRLQAAMAPAMAEGEGGFIVRTAAAEAEDDELAHEAARLRARWEEIEAARDQSRAPAALHRDVEPALRALREHGGADLEAVAVDDADLFARLQAFVAAEMTDLAEVLRHHAGPDALFAAEGIEDAVEALLDPHVPLPCGGGLIISETPALTAIDVNTGAADFGNKETTALEVNIEAAREIARQVQLRNLSGLLVVDFVSTRRRESQSALAEALEAALAEDALRPNLIGFTRLGLAEITRRRQGASLAELLCGEPAAPERSPETVALAALRAVLAEARRQTAPGYVLEVASAVADALAGPQAEALADARRRLGGNLEIIARPELAASVYFVRAQGGK